MNKQQKLAALIAEIKGLNGKADRTADESASLEAKLKEASTLRSEIESENAIAKQIAELDAFDNNPVNGLPPAHKSGRPGPTTFTPDGTAQIKEGEKADSFEFEFGGISEKQALAIKEPTYYKAWNRWLRGMSDNADYKALAEGLDESGGYLVPAQTETEILREDSRIPGLYNRVGKRTTSSNRVVFPTMPYSDPAEIQANPYFQQFVGETGSPYTQPDLRFGEKTIDVHKAAFEVPFSTDLLEDTGDVLLREIQSAAQESYALGLERFITAGLGVGQPFGIMNQLAPAGRIEVVPIGATINALTMRQLILFTHQLPIQYRVGASFFTSDEVFGELCAVTDGNNNLVNMFGRIDKNSGLSNAFEPTLLGRGVDTAPYLPGPGANNIIMLIGQWARAYYLVTRRGFTVTRITEQSDKYRGSGMNALHFSYRVGGDVVRPWSIKAGRQAN